LNRYYTTRIILNMKTLVKRMGFGEFLKVSKWLRALGSL
jgi:hypothetical protein